MQPRSLLASWKRDAWMRRLCGVAIWDDSTGHASADTWMRSLRGFPVNRSPSPGRSAASLTNAPFGLTSLDLFASLERGSFVSKTCQVSLLPEDSIRLSVIWPRSGSMRNGECYQRPPLELRTDASGCSSSAWLTPHGITGVDYSGKLGAGGEFAAQVERWPTPDCNTSTYSNGFAGPNIREAAAQWQTPKAGEEDSGSGMNSRGEPKLKAQAMLWRTPDVPSSGGIRTRRDSIGNGHQVVLAEQVEAWPTPAARDHRGGGYGSDATGREIEDGHAGLESGELADAALGGLGIDGRASRVGGHASLGDAGIFAPGPSDPRWPAIIAASPWLAPATQSGVRVVADGLALVVDQSRRDQLRCIGNGVVPLQAACAVVELVRRLK